MSSLLIKVQVISGSVLQVSVSASLSLMGLATPVLGGVPDALEKVLAPLKSFRTAF